MKHSLWRHPVTITALVLGVPTVIYATASIAAPKLLFAYKVTQCISKPLECLKGASKPGLNPLINAEVNSEVTEAIPKPRITHKTISRSECEAIRTAQACDLYFERQRNAN